MDADYHGLDYERILQIIPAQDWVFVLDYGDGYDAPPIEFQPIACWALVELRREPHESPMQRVVAMHPELGLSWLEQVEGEYCAGVVHRSQVPEPGLSNEEMREHLSQAKNGLGEIPRSVRR